MRRQCRVREVFDFYNGWENLSERISAYLAYGLPLKYGGYGGYVSYSLGESQGMDRVAQNYRDGSTKKVSSKAGKYLLFKNGEQRIGIVLTSVHRMHSAKEEDGSMH